MSFFNLDNTLYLLIIGITVIVSTIFIGIILLKLRGVRNFEKSYKELLQYKGTSIFQSYIRLAILIFVGLILFVIVLLRPISGSDIVTTKASNLDIMIVVDTSLSMSVRDMPNNASRIEATKTLLSSIVKARNTDRIGLVSFSSLATPELPLTTDYTTVQTGIETLRLVDFSYSKGSSVAIGIAEAVTRLTANESSQNRAKAIILVGDGEEKNATSGGIDVVSAAKSANIPIYSIGVGTSTGGDVLYKIGLGNDAKELPLYDVNGRAVSKRIPGEYERLSSQTNGKYWDYESFSLSELTSKLVAGQSDLQTKSSKVNNELYYFFTPFLVILGLIIVLRLYERVRNEEPKQKTVRLNFVNPIVILLLFFNIGSYGYNLAKEQIAYTDVKTENYSDAEKLYLSLNPTTDYKSIYNAGIADYKGNFYDTAITQFTSATDSDNATIKQASYYNLGNAQYRKGEGTLALDPQQTITYWEKAIKSYEKAIELDPNDTDAKENLEYVKNKLAALKLSQKQSNSTTKPDETVSDNEKKRVNDADKKAKEDYNQYGRYKNDSNYENTDGNDISW